MSNIHDSTSLLIIVGVFYQGWAVYLVYLLYMEAGCSAAESTEYKTHFANMLRRKKEYADMVHLLDSRHSYRRQNADKETDSPIQKKKRDRQGTTTKPTARTIPLAPVSFKEDCMYLAYYCMQSFSTGPICARSPYYIYNNFTNYCELEYVNCMERYDLWQISYMGKCYHTAELLTFNHYPYAEDYWLDRYTMFEDEVSQI